MKILKLFVMFLGVVCAEEISEVCLNPSFSDIIDVNIIGGKTAEHKYPFMGSLQRSGNHFCGASLIHPEWAMTAGHCVKTDDVKNLRLVFNQYNLRAKPMKYQTIRDVKEIKRHPQHYSLTNDIALLKIQAIQELRPVSLNRIKEYEAPGKKQRVIGWGYTKEGSGKLSNVLMQVDVPVVSETVCKNPYPNVNNQNICAGYNAGKKDSCSGDSGGPLFYITQNGMPSQTGIVSYGRGCARAGYYGVYTRVSYYLDWITGITGKLPELSLDVPKFKYYPNKKCRWSTGYIKKFKLGVNHCYTKCKELDNCAFFYINPNNKYCYLFNNRCKIQGKKKFKLYQML